MGRSRKPAETFIQKNLYKLLGPNLDDSLKKIEKETGISIFTVRTWLNGRRNPSLENLKKVAGCIGFRWAEIFNTDIEKQITPKQKEIIRLIPQVKNESLLDGILSIIDSQIIDGK